MKTLLSGLLLFFTFGAFSQVNPNYHNVKKYTRKDGTQVQSHKRTNPNYTNRDNYTTRPNVNPFTGKEGNIEPDNNSNNWIDKLGTKGNLGYVEPSSSFSIYSDPFVMTRDEIDRALEQAEIQAKEYGEFYKNINASQGIYSPLNIYKPLNTYEELLPLNTYEIDKNSKKVSSYNYNVFDTPQKKIERAIRYHNKYSSKTRLYMEKLLKKVNLFNGKVDGVFTDSTIKAIKELQRFLNVSVDGKLGNETLTALENY